MTDKNRLQPPRRVFYNGIDGFSIRVACTQTEGQTCWCTTTGTRKGNACLWCKLSVATCRVGRPFGHRTRRRRHYEEHQETMSRSKERVYPHVRSTFQRQTLRIHAQPGFLHGQRRPFRRSYERMTWPSWPKPAILWAPKSARRKELELQAQRGLAGGYSWPASRRRDTTDGPLTLAASLASKPGRAPFNRRKSRATKSSIDNAVANMEGKLLRQHRPTSNGTASTSAGMHGALLGGELVGGARGQGWIGPARCWFACSCCTTWSRWSASKKSGTLEPWSACG